MMRCVADHPVSWSCHFLLHSQLQGVNDPQHLTVWNSTHTITAGATDELSTEVHLKLRPVVAG